LLAVKGNQPTMKGEIENHLELRKPKVYKRPSIDFFETKEKSRDRYEIRRCWVASENRAVSKVPDWSDLKTIARAESELTHKGKTSVEQRYYICSKQLTAEEVIHASRSHYGVESMHWMRDVLKRDKETKLSINNKRFKAGNDFDYLNKWVTSFDV
jgi:predicted transposase YbfD/YdcC